MASMPGGAIVSSSAQMASQINFLLADQRAWADLSLTSFRASKTIYDPENVLPKVLSLLT